MKTKFLAILILNLVLFSMCHCKKIQAQNNYSNDTALSMLYKFYTSYINECSIVPTNFEKIDSIKNKYCTTNLLNKNKELYETQELDYDLFLNAQDCTNLSLKTLTIQKDSTKNNVYVVSYSYGDNPIRLFVIKENGIYKIDAIL